MKHIGKGKGENHADEARSLGLKVGDVIRGREDYHGGWNEVRLTVLWMGERCVVYRRQWRGNYTPEGLWIDSGEVATFTLSCREYYLENNQ